MDYFLNFEKHFVKWNCKDLGNFKHPSFSYTLIKLFQVYVNLKLISIVTYLNFQVVFHGGKVFCARGNFSNISALGRNIALLKDNVLEKEAVLEMLTKEIQSNSPDLIVKIRDITTPSGSFYVSENAGRLYFVSFVVFFFYFSELTSQHVFVKFQEN